MAKKPSFSFGKANDYRINSGRFAYDPVETGLEVPENMRKFLPEKTKVSPLRNAAAERAALIKRFSDDSSWRTAKILKEANKSSFGKTILGGALRNAGRLAGPVGALIGMTTPVGVGSDKPPKYGMSLRDRAYKQARSSSGRAPAASAAASKSFASKASVGPQKSSSVSRISGGTQGRNSSDYSSSKTNSASYGRAPGSSAAAARSSFSKGSSVSRISGGTAGSNAGGYKSSAGVSSSVSRISGGTAGSNAARASSSKPTGTSRFAKGSLVSSKVNSAGNYTKPAMRKKMFESIKASSVQGTKAGQWSARKAQLLAKKYKASGGGYRG